MKIKMLETFQEVGTVAVLERTGTNVAVLDEGETYIVSLTLGSWLVDNHKAEEVTEEKAAPKHYGAQEQPELRHDDEIYKEVKAEAEAQDEPIMTSEKAPKRSKRTK